MSDFGLGAVGIIDALGFRGIWKRGGVVVQDVLNTLKMAKQTAIQMAETMHGLGSDDVFHSSGHFPEISAIAFSDTIAVTAVVPGSEDRSATLAATAGVVAASLAYIMRRTAQSAVPLIYRGVVTTGDCLVDSKDHVLLGEAVDRAAELMDLADGAFVWLAPGTAELDFARWEGAFWNGLLAEYNVPLKGARTIGTKVVSPFVHSSYLAPEFEKIRQGYRTFMASNDLDVAVKRQNTEALLDQLEEQSRRHMDLMERLHRGTAEVRGERTKDPG